MPKFEGGDSEAPTASPGDFDAKNFTINSTKEVKLHKGLEKTGKPADYPATILRKAGKDPKAWHSNFTGPTFIGQKFKQPIHVALTSHLQSRESAIVQALGKDGESTRQAEERG